MSNLFNDTYIPSYPYFDPLICHYGPSALQAFIYIFSLTNQALSF